MLRAQRPARMGSSASHGRSRRRHRPVPFSNTRIAPKDRCHFPPRPWIPGVACQSSPQPLPLVLRIYAPCGRFRRHPPNRLGVSRMQLSNYLFFATTCEQALAFLRGLRPWADRRDHAARRGRNAGAGARHAGPRHAREVRRPGVLFYASDNDDAEPMRGSAHILMLDDPERTTELFGRLGEGGTVTTQLGLQPWGDLYGKLTDRFGVQWMPTAPSEPRSDVPLARPLASARSSGSILGPSLPCPTLPCPRLPCPSCLAQAALPGLPAMEQAAPGLPARGGPGRR